MTAEVLTGALDVLCALGVVGAALVTGMADVARGGSPGGTGRVRSAGPPPAGRGVRSAGGCPGGRGRGEGA